jgi:hypothetical protein
MGAAEAAAGEGEDEGEGEVEGKDKGEGDGGSLARATNMRPRAVESANKMAASAARVVVSTGKYLIDGKKKTIANETTGTAVICVYI